MLKFRWETEFKETEIGEIPKDWEVRKIEEIADVSTGGTPSRKNEEYWGGDINWVKSQEVRKYFIWETEEKITEKGMRKSNAKRIYLPNTVLIALYGATAGEAALLKVPATVNQAIAALEGHKTNNLFLFYLLLANKERLKDISIGSAQQNLYLKDIKNFEVALPPANDEQSRIATVLSWFDDLIENKKRQNEILEKVAMAIFKSWFVDFEPFKDEEFVYNEELGKEIPKEWKVKKLGKLIKIESGGYAPQGEKYFTNGKYPFVRVKHLSNQPCINGCDFINDDAVRDYKLKLFKEGSIIFQKSGESLSFARVNILPFDCYIVNHLAIVDSAESKNLGFIYCVLKNLLFEIIEERTGTALPYMKISDIQKKIILKPPDSILQRFHSLVEPLFQKIILNQKQIMVLRKIRDALLPKLVFGKLRVVEI